VPLRVLVVSTMRPSPAAPQFGIFVSRQVEALADLGADVTFIGADRGARGVVRTPARYAALAARARAAARRARPDVVVGHFLVPGGEVARLAAGAVGVPYVLVAHGQDVTNAETSRPLRRLTQRALDRAAALVVVAPALAERLSAAVDVGCPVEVIDVGVDRRLFHPGDRDVAAHALGPEPDRPLVVQIGNLIERKNPLRLAEAVAVLRERRGGGELWIAGDGPLATSLADLPHVRLLGAVAPETIPRVLRAADCATLVALREGYGLGALEAVACGVPTVVSVGVPVAADLPASAAVTVDPRVGHRDRRRARTRPAPAARRARGQAAADGHALDRQAARLLALLTEVVGQGRSR
jgi:glycosyltransferase involved in cell wall biosynthesis